MKFTRLGENEIRCIISEEELFSFGIDLDDILSKNNKSGRFFNEILSRAALVLGEDGTKDIRGCSAQINVLNDRSISILFHTRKGDVVSEFAEKIKEAGERVRNDNRSFLVSFDSLDGAISLCRACHGAGHILSRFYKNRRSGKYVLLFLRYACNDNDFNKIQLLSGEYGRVCSSDAAHKAYILEESDMLISDDAFYVLGEM